jgi:hydroxyacylglutathione hydrolase
MHPEDKKSKNNLKALAIGFLLILLTIALFFLKNYLFGKKDKTPNVANNLAQDITKYKSISGANLLKKIASRKPIAILDIRDSNGFEMEHIADSINIPPGTSEDNLPTPEDKEYFIVDYLGLTQNEIQIMETLLGKGFNVSYLEGGFIGWKNQLNPTVSFGDPSSFTDQAKITYMKNDELEKASKEENLYIIDLRSEKEFNDGHISGTVNINLADLEKRRNEIPIDRKIILYDNNGFEAFQGAVRLFDLGILNVYMLSDGIQAWKQKGFELVK